MASINELLKRVRYALLGKEIRQTIHDAIEQCYEEASKRVTANTEVVAARGDYSTLGERLDNIVTLESLEKIEEQTITPGVEDITLEAGKYINGDITIEGDNNLITKNIARDSSIFGVKGSLDKMRRIDGYSGGSGYYGIEVADVARSYHLARVNGNADFKYSQSNIWSGNLTSAEGYCLIDCSTFVNLVLRGIDYLHSPYNAATGVANLPYTPSDIATLCAQSEYVWADEWLDKQTDESFRDIGISGRRSVRTAAQIAEYYYGGKGAILYEYETSPTEVPTGLLPGDLVFWSKASANDEQKSRFKGISHVGIVGKDGTNYYHATGYEETKGNTILYWNLEEHLEELSLILRPDYNPRVVTTTPLNHNLLPQYEFSSCGVQENTVKNGVTFAPQTTGGLTVQGVPMANTTFYICSNNDLIPLEPGRYILSGTPIHPEVDVSSHVWTWGLTMKDADNNETFVDTEGYRVWDRGQGSVFDITETTQVRIYFSVAQGLTDTASYLVKPSLIRIS